MRVVSIVLMLASLSSGLGQSSPGSRFVINGGEAYDRKTGLIWQRCIVGRVWRDGKCAG